MCLERGLCTWCSSADCLQSHEPIGSPCLLVLHFCGGEWVCLCTSVQFLNAFWSLLAVEPICISKILARVGSAQAGLMPTWRDSSGRIIWEMSGNKWQEERPCWRLWWWHLKTWYVPDALGHVRLLGMFCASASLWTAGCASRWKPSWVCVALIHHNFRKQEH